MSRLGLLKLCSFVVMWFWKLCVLVDVLFVLCVRCRLLFSVCRVFRLMLLCSSFS